MPRTLSIDSAAIPLVLGEPALIPVKLSGREGINQLFEYELLVKTPDTLNRGAELAANFDLDTFIGHEISCTIELDPSGPDEPTTREINALIAHATQVREEGRHILYRLTLRPWLHLATRTVDCRIFQNRNVVAILDEVLDSYHFPVGKRLWGPESGVSNKYPERDFQTQFNETDFEFFSRLCQEWGINYHFEHADGHHRLVLTDHVVECLPNPACKFVDYHAPGWKADREYLHSFMPEHQLTSGRYATRDWDYTDPRFPIEGVRRDPRATAHADREVYQWHADLAGSHIAQPQAGTAEPNDARAEARQLVILRMQALRTHAVRARASGNLRGMAPGHTFRLRGHPRDGANSEHLILDTEFTIEDVAEASQVPGAARQRSQRWQITVDLTLQPVAEPLRPLATQRKPMSAGAQVARVVGPPGESIWTDKYGRIKVLFPWDRDGQENQDASCWLRVSSPWAGNQFGSIQIPRVGQEVIVVFIGGDPDLPLCLGRVHNQLNLPPWALPGQSALSGFRSRELTDGGGNSAAGRSNHLVLDDTAGKIQVQLKSDYMHSSLSLGCITRIDGHAGRQDPRGEGFELRADGHGVLRAQDGLLLTTEPRAKAVKHAKDLDETAHRLATSNTLHHDLAESAQQAEAQVAGEVDELTRALTEQHEEVKGTGASSEGQFPELSQPHLVLSSPAGIETSTSKSTHTASLQHNVLTSGGHTSVAAGKSFFASVKEAIRLFAYDSVIKLVAARADIDLVALRAGINLLAKLQVTVTADKITIRAKEQLEIGGGGSSATFNHAGITTMTPGHWVVHADAHSLTGPASKSGELAFPSTRFEGCDPSIQAAAAAQSALFKGD